MVGGEVSGGLVDVALAVAIKAQAVLLQHVFPPKFRLCAGYVLEIVEPVSVEDPEAGGPEELLPHRVGPV